MPLNLPDKPILADVVAALTALEGRLAALEVWQAGHELWKVERQRQVDAALDELRRMRRASPR